MQILFIWLELLFYHQLYEKNDFYRDNLGIIDFIQKIDSSALNGMVEFNIEFDKYSENRFDVNKTSIEYNNINISISFYERKKAAPRIKCNTKEKSL